MHIVDEKGDQVRDVVETKDGTVARLILRDGRALTTEEDQAERDRLSALVESPADYFRHTKSEANGKKTAADLIRMMPDAMLFTYAPGQPQTGRGNGQGEVVLDYHPNPDWKPPSTVSEALTGLEGRVWIDVKTRHIVRMQGHTFKAVNVGWGIVARIYPGGDLLLEQTDAGDNRWIFTHFTQDVTVRALLVKALHVHAQVDASEFRTITRPMSYQEAIKALLATPLPKG